MKGVLSAVLVAFVAIFGFLVGTASVSARGILVASQSQIDNTPGLYLFLGNSVYHGGGVEVARQVYAKGLLLGEDARLLNNLGAVAAGEGQDVVAEQYFLRALSADPSYEKPRMGLAVLYHNEKKYGQAIAELGQLILLDAKNPSYHYDLAINLADDVRENNADPGMLDVAIAQFQEADRLLTGYMKSRENIAALENVKRAMGLA